MLLGYFLHFALLFADFGQSAVWHPPPNFRDTVLLLLCYKRNAQQRGQQGSCGTSRRAIRSLRVLMELGLCRSARARRAAGLEAGRNLRGA